jgi:RimJ/RimL family protein N-acetyltransferase
MMEEKDQDNYFALAINEERNKFWGYDYYQDLKEGEKATPEFFYDDIKKDYASKDCFSYMIKDKAGQFIGEAVLYDFRNDGSGEIGLRLLPPYEGQGYAKEAGLLLIKLSREIGLSFLRYESYLENGRSLLLAKNLGFCAKGEDNLKVYFSLKL